MATIPQKSGPTACGVGLEAYRDIIGSRALDRLKAAADRVRPWKLQHVNSTLVGGGVAEILTRMIPLIRELGVETSWDVIRGNDDFFKATKAFHNALHGTPNCTTPRMFEAFRETTEQNRRSFEVSGDVMLVHDPQPAGLIDRRKHAGRKWVWRC